MERKKEEADGVGERLLFSLLLLLVTGRSGRRRRISPCICALLVS